VPRVDARASEEHQLTNACAVCCVDHIEFDRQVVSYEIGGVRVVGQDTSDLGRRKKNVFRPFLLEERVHCCLIREFKFGMASEDQILVSTPEELPNDRRPHQPQVARNVNLALAA
jgi:hypothetical protein